MARNERRVAGLGVVLLLAALSGCPIIAPGGESVIDYDTRVVDISDIVDLEDRDFRLRETQVYGSTGKISGQFLYAYDVDGVDTVDTYSYDTEGTRTLTEHQKITLNTDDLVTRSESYNSDGDLKSYIDVTYDGDYTTSYAMWTLTAVDGTTETTQSQRVATYYKNQADTDWNGELRTEQLFSRDDDGNMKLSKESAYWYDSQGLVVAEIEHVLRGTDQAADAVLPDGVDERYFYYSYSRNPQDLVFSRIQYLYEDYTDADGDGKPDLSEYAATLRSAATGAFPVVVADNPFAYSIDNDAVKYQVGMEISDYDGEGNLIRETVYSFGVLQEIRTYAWLEEGLQTESARYVNGGVVLDEKIVTRYRVEKIGADDCWVKETFKYYTDDAIDLEQNLGETS